MRWLTIWLLLAACSASPATDSPADPTITALPSADSVVATDGDVPDEMTPSTTVDAGEVDEPTSPTTADTLDPNAVVPDGFARTKALVTKSDGATCEICVWIAETQAQRAQGLMRVTDLGAADAMAFVYPSARTGSFWMKDTVMQLSIAFYGTDGGYLDAFDMEPCVTEECESYPTPTDFLIAVEVLQGQLDAVGMTPASTFELLDLSCDDAP